MRVLFIILIFFITLNTFADKNNDDIKNIISKMTIKEKIGQLFNISIVGKKLKPKYKKFINNLCN